MNIPVIAIDGPAGAGTTTAVEHIAAQLEWNTLYSGMIYRALGVIALSEGISVEDEEAIVDGAVPLLNMFLYFNGNKIMFAEQDLTSLVYERRAGVCASIVAKHPKVRESVLEFQLSLRQSPGLVAEGRDMCHIFCEDNGPVARIYLTADPNVRARRRCAQIGGFSDYGKVLAEILERDSADMNRTHSPLVQHPKALRITSDTLTPQQVASVIIKYSMSVFEAKP